MIRLLLISLLLCTAAIAQFPAGCGSTVTVPGPAHFDTSQYATLHLIREHDPAGVKYWFYVGLDSLQYIKTNDNEKYTARVYKAGNYEIWTRAEGRTSFRTTLIAGRSYYISMSMGKGEKHPQPILTLLDSSAGAAAFKSSAAKEIYIDYPIPTVKDIPLTSQKTVVEYWDPGTSMDYGVLKLYQPSWAHVVEYTPMFGILMFTYFDPLVSATYSELAELSWIDNKAFKDTVSFYKFVTQHALKGIVKKEGETVVGDTHVTDIKLPGNFYYLKKLTTHDTQPKQAGNHSFLQIDSYVGILYVDDGKKGKVYKLIYSQRGLPGELHNDADFKCRFRDFAERITVK